MSTVASSTVASLSPTAEVEAKLKLWKALNEEIQTLYTQKTQSLSQFNENTLVKGELDLLSKEEEGESSVFKLIGPVLVAVELEGAKENVAKRLEFIESEIQRLDAAIESKQAVQKTLGDEIAAAQSKVAADAAEEARKVVKEVTAR